MKLRCLNWIQLDVALFDHIISLEADYWSTVEPPVSGHPRDQKKYPS